ncbi:hypothetical protein TNCT_6171 [Trichonephila clavata]|uniref:Uncharacterized protein n=1 Tax=Trichonephila clavata TaxID=2740835 RepID=A0A8X6H0U9_TRICU|nr:hypothetical protein TNCT_6171 [Trichonephila clavata]
MRIAEINTIPMIEPQARLPIELVWLRNQAPFNGVFVGLFFIQHIILRMPGNYVLPEEISLLRTQYRCGIRWWMVFFYSVKMPK